LNCEPATLHFEGPHRDTLNGRGRGELVALFWILLFSPAAVSAVDLFSFGYDGKILGFAVPNSDPVAATVKDSEAETIALNLAVRFYGAQDVNFDGGALRIQPARFWLVRLASNFGPAHLMLYAVVLPDGSIVVPTIREWLGVDVMQNLEFASHYQLWFDRVDLLRNLGWIFDCWFVCEKRPQSIDCSFNPSSLNPVPE
jgi:hypothetical protein